MGKSRAGDVRQKQSKIQMGESSPHQRVRGEEMGAESLPASTFPLALKQARRGDLGQRVWCL